MFAVPSPLFMTMQKKPLSMGTYNMPPTFLSWGSYKKTAFYPPPLFVPIISNLAGPDSVSSYGPSGAGALRHDGLAQPVH